MIICIQNTQGYLQFSSYHSFTNIVNLILNLNYEDIAPQYNQRYNSSSLPERINSVIELVQLIGAQHILEVGCGTGFWLDLLVPGVETAYELGYSSGILDRAKERLAALRLSRGNAIHLPYQNNSFDIVYCVDVIHHFGKPQVFISEAFRVLHPGGVLAVIGSDPHSGDEVCYVYDHFQSVLETDLRRFPAECTILIWMQEEGFQNLTSKCVEHISSTYLGCEVFNDPFLKKNSCSQLALLNNKTIKPDLKR